MKKRVLNIEEQWDYKISFYVVFYFFAEVANAAIKTILPIPESLWGILSLMWGLAIMFFLFRSFKAIKQRNRSLLVKTLVIITAIYLYSLLLILLRDEPTNAFWRKAVMVSYAWWIPVGIASASVKNKAILYQTYLKWSYLMGFLLSICVLRPASQLSAEGVEYNMFVGFHLVVPTLFHITEYRRSHSKIALFAFLGETIIIIFFGNRGALLPLIFYFTYISIFAPHQSLIKKIMGVFLIVIVVVFSSGFLRSLGGLASYFNVESRTLTLMEEGNVMDPSGRDELADITIEMIKERPITGWGLGGEYYEIGKEMSGFYAETASAAFSPHNGILELLVCFGIFGGAIAIFVFFLPMFRLNRIKDQFTFLLTLIFLSGYLTPCIVSADGLLFKAGAAVYIFLFYSYNSNKSGKNI